jgi:glutamine synthetase
MLSAEAEYVLRTVEERDIRFIRLWFTDVLGFLKAFTITSQELEGALTDGMGFDGSGNSTMSDSWIRLNPSIEEPSNPMPSANAPSSSCDVIVKDFRNPRTSVNQRRTNRIPRSSIVRNT